MHTHSIASPDGSLQLSDYRSMLDKQKLDYIAITDHDTIDFAVEAQAALGARIIVGEEISTTEGELIGLYLTEAVPPQLSAAEAVRAIKQQGGLVYVPHPFETVRKGLTEQALAAIAHSVDIVEIYNGRALQKRGGQAESWATGRHLPGAASSDAHGKHGWGRTYSVVDRVPTVDTLPQLLGAARFVHRWPGIVGLLYPKFNRLRGGTRRG
ncbi:MAG TPA: PHP domain-containing protein [Bacillota bacterium]|nr:PHP domain-containing protein [Bacillota bacterium]